MRRLSTIIPFLSMLAVFACTARLDIDTIDSERYLVIYGTISNDTTLYGIEISRSVPFFSTRSHDPVTDAVVTVSDGDKTYPFLEHKGMPGTYISPFFLRGVPGTTYRMEVTADIDGDGTLRTFIAESYMPLPARMDTIMLRPSEALSDYVEVLVWATLPDEERFDISYHLYRDRFNVNDSLSQFRILDDKFLDTDRFEGVPCFYLDQTDNKTELHPGNLITMRMDILTKEYGTFLRNTRKEVIGSVPFFSGPPANVQSNITCLEDTGYPIAGFFAAFSSIPGTTYWLPE